jgi:hypothetical protein
MPKSVSQYLAAIGAKGGKAKSRAKAKASRANGAKPCAPGKKRGRPRSPK